jgi:hypothetical protein
MTAANDLSVRRALEAGGPGVRLQNYGFSRSDRSSYRAFQQICQTFEKTAGVETIKENNNWFPSTFLAAPTCRSSIRRRYIGDSACLLDCT